MLSKVLFLALFSSLISFANHSDNGFYDGDEYGHSEVSLFCAENVLKNIYGQEVQRFNYNFQCDAALAQVSN